MGLKLSDGQYFHDTVDQKKNEIGLISGWHSGLGH